jgi:type IV pilus assembly protein PilA
MKSDLQVKFLSFMAGRKKGEGFTLIELLVVIIIIGILAAIALPSFLNQANKAKQSEAKQYVGTVVRGQQAHYLEFTQFGTSIVEIGTPVVSDTTNYEYRVEGGGKGATSVVVHGKSKADALKAYVGGVYLGTVTATSEATTVGIVCQNNAPKKGDAAAVPVAPAKAGESATCGGATTAL